MRNRIINILEKKNSLLLYTFKTIMSYIDDHFFLKTRIDFWRISKIDSIMNYQKYINTISKYIEMNRVVAFPGNYSGNTYYGHYKTICDYAGVHKGVIPFLGEMEHGIRFSKQPIDYQEGIIAYTVQGEERANELIEKKESIPILRIGPYIKYAKSFYSEERLAREKAKLGKVLLVFPSHSWELSSKKNDENDFMSWVFSDLKNSFDTIMICVYWKDALAPQIKEYEKKGCKLVCAGCRSDYNFLRKLKTIIELSDVVAGDDMGTNIGYAMALNKPYILYSDNIDKTVYLEKYVEIFSKAFLYDVNGFSENQLDNQRRIYNSFWGGDIFFTPKELKKISVIIRKIIRKANYDIGIYKELMNKEYMGDGEILTSDELELLRKVVYGI